jgi:hypothetical protein
MSAARPVAPDAVHVWRGYRATTKAPADFAAFLGTVFVPACALLQPKAGLRAFVPSLLPEGGKPPGVPDQTALMFWADQQAYNDAFKTVAVRAYTNLHGDAYGPPSQAQFPVVLGSAIVPEQPYHLLTAETDWMLGSVDHFVGARSPTQSTSDFLSSVGTWASTYHGSPPAGVDGALVCAGNDYVVFWEHSPEAGDGPRPTGLEAVSQPVFVKSAVPFVPPAGLWDEWEGMDLTANDCVNMQLDRP